MRSRTEIEMAFMEILKIIQHQVFLRNCRGKVLEKFPVFSDTTAGLCEFSTPASAGCQPRLVRSSRTTRSRSEPPNHASACLGVMLVNCQLSGGADTSQEGRPTSTRSLRRLGPAKPLSLQPVIGWLTRLKEAGSGRDSHRTE